jgi:hypothetical protein
VVRGGVGASTTGPQPQSQRFTGVVTPCPQRVMPVGALERARRRTGRLDRGGPGIPGPSALSDSSNLADPGVPHRRGPESWPKRPERRLVATSTSRMISLTSGGRPTVRGDPQDHRRPIDQGVASPRRSSPRADDRLGHVIRLTEQECPTWIDEARTFNCDRAVALGWPHEDGSRASASSTRLVDGGGVASTTTAAVSSGTSGSK